MDPIPKNWDRWRQWIEPKSRRGWGRERPASLNLCFLDQLQCSLYFLSYHFTFSKQKQEIQMNSNEAAAARGFFQFVECAITSPLGGFAHFVPLSMTQPFFVWLIPAHPQARGIGHHFFREAFFHPQTWLRPPILCSYGVLYFPSETHHLSYLFNVCFLTR